MKAVEVRGLSFRYEGSEEWALREVDLEIDRGELVLVLGPTGSGKSTFLRCLIGLIPHFYSGEYLGSVRVMGMEVASTPVHRLATRVGMVFQNPETQIFSTSVESELAFPLENLGVPPEEIRRRVEDALDRFGLRDLRRRNPAELSGGQKQRLAIATVTAMGPDVLLLDEPTSMLDPLAAKEVLDLVVELCREEGRTVLLSEHRTDLIAPHADRVIAFSGGRVIYSGDPRSFFSELRRGEIPVPRVVELYWRLRDSCRLDGPVPLLPEELEALISRKVRGGVGGR
jgi:energy-coupling factor transporter ATP-binding protein EcfA2